MTRFMAAILTIAATWGIPPFVLCAETSTIRRNTVQLEIKAPKDRFILKESLVFTVRILNDGSAPLETPKITDSRNTSLVYELHGPTAPGGLRFHYGSAGNFQLPGGPEPVTVSPGESQVSDVDMVQFVQDWKAGDHEIMVHWNGADSAPFRFTILAPTVKSAQVLSDGWPANWGMMRIALIEAGGGLYQGFYDETDRTGATPPQHRFVHALNVPVDAEAVLMPWTNFDRMSVFFTRFGWATDKKLGIEELSPDSRVEMDIEGRRVLGPALMTQAGNVILFLANDNRLSMARIPRKGEGDPEIVWEVEVSGEIASGSAALGPQDAGSLAAVTAVVSDDAGIRLLVASDGKIREAAVDGVQPAPGTRPALWIEADGSMRTAVVAVVPNDENEHRVQVVEAIWPAGEAEGRVSPGDAVVIPEWMPDVPLEEADRMRPEKIMGAAVAYAPGKDTRRLDWVVAMEHGEVVSSRAPGERRRFGIRPVMPLQLLERTSQAYLLVHHPTEVLELALLR